MEDDLKISEIGRNIDKIIDDQVAILDELQNTCNFFKLFSLVLLVALAAESLYIFAII